MMSGVAQVMAIKPILMLLFSSEPFFSCAIACNWLIGNREEIADIAVAPPTARKKLRRTLSCGNNAFTKVASTKSCESVSGLVPRLRKARISAALCEC